MVGAVERSSFVGIAVYHGSLAYDSLEVAISIPVLVLVGASRHRSAVADDEVRAGVVAYRRSDR